MTTISKYMEIDIDIDDLIDDLAPSEKLELACKLTGDKSVPLGMGEGDHARINNIIDRAFNAARQLPAVPREIADLFWHIHGRALA